MAKKSKSASSKGKRSKKTVVESKPDLDTAARTNKIVHEVLEAINKDAGEHSAQLLSSEGQAIKVRGVISTQCPSIDLAIGRGGVPLSKITLIHGPEASGKTTLGFHLLAETQRRGGLCIYIDGEYKLDPDYARAVGVIKKQMVLSQPPYLEWAFKVMERVIEVAMQYRKDGIEVPVLIVLDSINSFMTKRQFEAGYEDVLIAEEARGWSSGLKRLVPKLSNADVALVLISQEREKPGVVFGNKIYPAGGKAPRFHASVILRVKTIGSVKENDKLVASTTQVYVSKNQIAPPFRTATFRINYGLGVDYEESLLREAVTAGIVTQNGAWFRYKTKRLGQGSDKAASTLRGNPEISLRIAEELGLKGREEVSNGEITNTLPDGEEEGT